MIATHWDGYPDDLGQDLMELEQLNISNIIKIAKKYTIDCAEESILSSLNKQRVKKIARRHKLTETEVKKGIRRGCLITVDDWEIGNIKYYDDIAAYEYKIKGEKIYFRKRHGTWSKNDCGKWQILKKRKVGDKNAPKH